jgi:RDD family
MSGAATRMRPSRDGDTPPATRRQRYGPADTRSRSLLISDMTGNSGRPRIFAFILDNLMATVAAFLAVAAVKTDSLYMAGGALCLTYLGYFFLSEATWSRTPGKYLQGLVVVDPSGARCGWRRALVRTLLRVVEAEHLIDEGHADAEHLRPLGDGAVSRREEINSIRLP